MKTSTTILDFGPLNKLTTPVLDKNTNSMDADDELRKIAEYIRDRTTHNSLIKPERIKFIYVKKPKKEAGRFIIGELIMRGDYEKMINDDFDYIVPVYYPVWKDLDIENKIIQLDKVLCGIDMGGDGEDEKLGKNQKDTREYSVNMNHFGIEKVIHSSETVHLAMVSAVEKQKELDKNARKGVMEDANDLNDLEE